MRSIPLEDAVSETNRGSPRILLGFGSVQWGLAEFSNQNWSKFEKIDHRLGDKCPASLPLHQVCGYIWKSLWKREESIAAQLRLKESGFHLKSKLKSFLSKQFLKAVTITNVCESKHSRQPSKHEHSVCPPLSAHLSGSCDICAQRYVITALF